MPIDNNYLPPLIQPKGPEITKLVLISDVPTEDDMKSGYSFSGGYAKTIASFCKTAGIPWDSIYKTNLIKERLNYNGTNRKLFKDAMKIALSHRDYAKILVDELKELNPQVITPLGEHSLKFLTGQSGIVKFRGSVLPLKTGFGLPNTVCVPSLPASHIFMDDKTKIYVPIDYKRIASILDGTYIIESANSQICESPDQLREFISRYKDSTWGVHDIETRYNIPVCIGLCFSRAEALTVPLIDAAVPKEILIDYWQQIYELILSKEWVNQNEKFDVHGITRLGFPPRFSVRGDTALRQSIIYPELPKNLGFLNSIYTDMPYFKDEGKVASNRKELYLYCGKDCISTYRIFEEQENDINDLGLKPFETKVQELFWPYVEIERRGIGIDDEQRKRLLGRYLTMLEVNLGHLRAHTNNKTFNPNSSDQCCELLYKVYHLPVIYSKQKTPTTDKEAIDNLLVHDDVQSDIHKYITLHLIKGCRKFRKIIEALDTPIHPDKRMRCSYDLGGTTTGRSSGKKTTDWLIEYDIEENSYELETIGHSLQTFGKHGWYLFGREYGKDLRSMFVPTKGFSFVEGDGSQAEARVDAVLAKSFEFIKEFDKKPGVHCMTGSWVYECLPTEIEKGTERYHISKIVRHAGERNMTFNRLATMIQRDKQFSKDILDRFHAKQPEIREVFHAEVRKIVEETRCLTSPHGRRRDFFGRLDWELYNEAISFIPQATVSDHFKFSIPIIEQRGKEANLSFGFVYEGHDALMAEVKKGQENEFAEIFKIAGERPINFSACSLSRDYDLVIPVELSKSDTNWQEMKEIH